MARIVRTNTLESPNYIFACPNLSTGQRGAPHARDPAVGGEHGTGRGRLPLGEPFLHDGVGLGEVLSQLAEVHSRGARPQAPRPRLGKGAGRFEALLRGTGGQLFTGFADASSVRMDSYMPSGQRKF